MYHAFSWLSCKQVLAEVYFAYKGISKCSGVRRKKILNKVWSVEKAS